MKNRGKKSASALTDLTPMMRQYLEVKSKYPDCILFFRLGDFYEMFFEDAEVASGILNIALTSRDRESKNPIPMCGVPYHSAQHYIKKLLENGYRVAICEQVEQPSKGKKLLAREVVRVYSPGVDYDFEKDENYNFLFVFIKREGMFGYAYADISTRIFRGGEFNAERELFDLVEKLQPSEIVMLFDPEKPVNHDTTLSNIKKFLSAKLFEKVSFPDDPDFSLRYIKERYGEVEWLKFRPSAAVACAGLLKFVSRFTPSSGILDKPEEDVRVEDSVIDASTLRNLEVFKTTSGDVKGSVFWAIDYTVSPSGRRKLKEWLQNPLKNRRLIQERLSGVDELFYTRDVRRTLRELLKQLPDAERVLSRIVAGVSTPQDLARLRSFLRVLPEVKEVLKGASSVYLHRIKNSISDFHALYTLLERAIVPEPPPHLRDGGVIKPEFDRELFELHQIKEKAGQWLSEFENRERNRTGIPSLKVGYNKVFGYYIEVTKTHLSKVPPEYERKQTLVNAERFIAPQLKEWEEKVLTSEERIVEREREIYVSLLNEVKAYKDKILTAARSLSELDALLSFAQCADECRFVKPEIIDEPVTEIRGGRHPAMEKMLGRGNFIPIDVNLDADDHQILIITGPNMAGKSTVLRTSAIIQLLAQAGSFVPADRATLGIADRITSRIGASDDITRGKSTFMVEMEETAEILKTSSKKSFIILDEIGRGTSTYDGISIAWAVVEHIHDRIGARCLCATHYHELTEISRLKQRVKNYTMEIREYADEVIFMYRLVRGKASRSYGVEVAKKANLPPEVLGRAEEILRSMEDGTGVGKLIREARQLSLFQQAPQDDALLSEILSVDLARITPLEAINLLHRLQQLAREKRRKG